MTTITHDQISARPPRRVPPWVIGFGLAALLVLALLAYGLRIRGLGQVDSGPAPPFTLTTFDGREVTLDELEGSPVVVNFWASWCIECYDEAPILEQASRDHDGEMIFLGVAYVDTEPEAREYLERFGITYPNGPDLGSRISDAYRVRGVPETFFIRADGSVASVKIGPFRDRSELDSYLALLETE